MNKRGAAGEGVLIIYRLMLVSLIAFVVLGAAAFYYNYEVDVRPSESGILAKSVFECVSNDGVFVADEESESLDLCGLSLDEKRYFVRVIYGDVSSDKFKILGEYEAGDSGALWMVDLYKEYRAGGEIENVEKIIKYAPGHYVENFCLKNKKSLLVEVLVKDE